MIRIKRIYEEYDSKDGYRILVDRLWPRGISKENAHIDLWLKEIGPSNELRKSFNHQVEKWLEFKKKFIQELKNNVENIKIIKEIISKHKDITLLYSAKDEKHNNAVVLLEYLKK